MTPRQKLFADIARRFPNISTNALGRMAYREAPEMFTNIRNAIGKAFHARNGGKANRLKPYLPKTRFRYGYAFPDGKTHFSDWEPLVIPGPAKALVLSDSHIPYHDKQALICALEFGRKNGVNLVVLNGDICDFFAASFWEKDPRKRNFAEELKTTKLFLEAVRAMFPKARLVYKMGNHEERWERYMFVKAPELLGVPEFEMKSLLDLSEDELVGDKRPIRLGDLNVLHGHEYKFAISNPVNPARGLFLRTKAYSICGHFHQSSSHSARTVEQKSMGTWSTGCLCNLHPDFLPINDWNHGFAFVDVARSGKFQVMNRYISEGRMY